MRPALPVKNLIRINWMLIGSFSAIILLFFLLLMEETELHKVYYALVTAMALALISFSNIGILKVLARRHAISSVFFRRKRILFTYLVSALIYIIMSPLFDVISPRSYNYSYPVYLVILVIGSVVINTIVLFTHDFVILQVTKNHAEREFSRLKVVHAEAANLLLKQQIQPHFLFNALSTLKALYWRDLEMADAYIVHLANFLRASVHTHASKTATVAEELDLLEDYLEMQRIRFGSALHCEIDLPEEIKLTAWLPAFSLQPLLENAIKHNELTSISPLNVRITAEEGWIVISNSLKRRCIQLPSTSYGLANLSERSRLLSGEDIIIQEDEHFFSVRIKLLSDAYRDN